MAYNSISPIREGIHYTAFVCISKLVSSFSLSLFCCNSLLSLDVRQLCSRVDIGFINERMKIKIKHKEKSQCPKVSSKFQLPWSLDTTSTDIGSGR